MPDQNQYGFGQGLVDAFPVAVNSLFKLRDQALQKEQFGLEQERFNYLKNQAEQERQDKLAQLAANSGTQEVSGRTAPREPLQSLFPATQSTQESVPNGGQGVLNSADLYGGNYQSGQEELDRLARDYKIYEEAFKAGDQTTVDAIAPYLKTSKGQPYVDLPYTNIATGETPPSGVITAYDTETARTLQPIYVPATTKKYSVLMSRPKSLEELATNLATKSGLSMEEVLKEKANLLRTATLSRGVQFEEKERKKEIQRLNQRFKNDTMRLHQDYLREWNKNQGDPEQQNQLTAQYYDSLDSLDAYYRDAFGQVEVTLNPGKGRRPAIGMATAKPGKPSVEDFYRK